MTAKHTSKPITAARGHDTDPSVRAKMERQKNNHKGKKKKESLENELNEMETYNISEKEIKIRDNTVHKQGR